MDRNEAMEQQLSLLLSTIGSKFESANKNIETFLSEKGEFDRIAQNFAREVEGTQQQLKQYNTPGIQPQSHQP